MKWIEKISKFFASLKLAVIVMLALGIISAWGTIVESRYDAQYAQKTVFHSPLMYFIMALLCVNLINVIIDRYPWKSHHTGFILAHVGIITLIVGALVTRYWGLDGSLVLKPGEPNRYVFLNDTEFRVVRSDGNGYWDRKYDNGTDFLLHSPRKKPIEFEVDGKKGIIKDYYHYARSEQKIVKSARAGDPPALRLQIQNQNVNMVEWIVREREAKVTALNLGPAKVIIREGAHEYGGGNEIVFSPIQGTDRLDYFVYTASKGGLQKKGMVGAGDVFEPGWMGLSVRVIEYFPQARNEIKFTPVDRPSGANTTSALLVEFNGEDHWVGLNSSVRVFGELEMYALTFRNRVIPLPIQLSLDKFDIGRYQGTSRAMTYSSYVKVLGLENEPQLENIHITMNEPLKHEGYTFYQASFEEDPVGGPTTSILSVNKDPGRAIKYLGSLLIVLGTLVMFYFKKYRIAILGSKT